MSVLAKIYRYLITAGLCIGIHNTCLSQDRISQLTAEVDLHRVDIPALDEKIEISVDEVELEEFLRGIATSNKLNISVDPGLDVKVTNNFVDITIADILIFLAGKYDLGISFIGNIITISPWKAPLVIEEKPDYRVIYDQVSGKMSLDFQNAALPEILKEVTLRSGKNVITSSGLESAKVSAYILDMPFDNALEKFAFSNNLEMSLSGDGFYILSKGEVSPENNRQGNRNNVQASNFEYKIVDEGNINVYAVETPVIDIIRTISTALGVNFYMLSEPSGNKSLNMREFSYDSFLEHLFMNTTFTYRKVNGIYLIGERVGEDLRDTRVVELQHRSVEKVVENIPAEIRTGVSIKEFSDLNSLILSGSIPNIMEIEKFIKGIDKIVPVVLIEVMIIDYSSGHMVSTGINAGIGEAPAAKSSGQLYPSVDYHLNSTSVNSLIESLNGYGWFKLGKVTPNFYLDIQALEEQGVLKVRSTPKLATLNGNEASLSIGNTEYYAVESNNVIGSQNPQNIITRSYQSVNADLTVTIKPFVSGDEQITLEITVEQSDFTARISPNAPPGSVTRSFKSLIRVRNEEMVLLGGLEQKTIEDTGKGLPFLSRIPVIKWFFSSRTRSRSSDKLNIFIKPTVFY